MLTATMKRLLLICSLCLIAATATAQERFSIFVGSAQENVERMIRIADIKDDDVVMDLGSGDGRIVFTALRANAKARGIGVDIDEKLVREANADAKKFGMAERVQFHVRDVFDTDLKSATVITMWLWPEMQRMLRTKILAEARPGTRVLTNIWDLGTWPADKVDTHDGSSVYLWVVPARVAGNWSWDIDVMGTSRRYDAVLEQNFQRAEGVVRHANRRGVLDKMTLRGEDIHFTLGMTVADTGFVTHTFSGKVKGDEIVGTVRLTRTLKEETTTTEVPWRATRVTTTSHYFAPTGEVPDKPVVKPGAR
jgi:hypothetical protein